MNSKYNKGKTLMLLGFGLVGSCLIETFMINKRLGNIINDFDRIVIIDPERKNEELLNLFKNDKSINIEVNRLYIEVKQDNIDNLLSNWTKTGDLIIDLSYNISFEPLLKWCLQTGVHYINTSMERWQLENENELTDVCSRLLHSTNNRAFEIQKEFTDSAKKNRSTLILTHGMNPGLITYFTFDGLVKIAKSCIKNKGIYDIILNKVHPFDENKLKNLQIALNKGDMARLAQILSVKAVHCSERDTQIMKDYKDISPELLKDVNLEGINLYKDNSKIFFNTWSPYGFYSEGVDPVQIGWGNEEMDLPSKICNKDIQIIDCNTAPDNQLYINKRGVDMYLYSYVPIINKSCGNYIDRVNQKDLSLNDRAFKDYEYIHNHNMSDGHIIGMNISHSENDTLNRALSIYDSKSNLIYRPSNYYVYSSSEISWESIYNVRKNQYEMLDYKLGLDNRFIKCGEDAVGALIIMKIDDVSHPISYWSGTILDIRQTRKWGYKYGACTTIQVVYSILSALKWLYSNKENSQRGIIYPEMMPWKDILNEAEPYLGSVYSDFVPFLSKSCNFKDMILEVL